MSEIATFLKVGSTAIVLSMIEDGVLNHLPYIANPVSAIRQISHDPSLRTTILLSNGKRATALEVQWSLLESAQKYAVTHDLDSVDRQAGELVLAEWELVLAGLEHDINSVSDVVDWVAKQRIVDGFARRHSLNSSDARLKAIDIQYHDLRIHKSLASRAGLRVMIDENSAFRAMTEPPGTTRAFFRGTCLQKWPESIVAANWDSLVFDLGLDSLVRVPMMEPLRGTRELTETLLNECSTPVELIDRLGGTIRTL